MAYPLRKTLETTANLMETLTAPRTQVPTYVIDGSKARTWPEIVASINAFIPGSEWQGNSLDALDDILYGGYGTPEKFVVVWKASEVSRQALGLDETRSYFKNMPTAYTLNAAGKTEPRSKTLFETLVEIFEGHDNIELCLE